MMRLVTADEMKAIDRHAIEQVGIPSVVLMENAGIKTLFTLEKVLGSLPRHRFTIVCGRGNNGGDGLVVARHLVNHQLPVHTFVVGDESRLSPDSAANLKMLRGAGYEPIFMQGPEDLDRLRVALEFSTIVLDALFGTGFAGQIEGYAAEIVQIINRGRATRVSIDLPSGVDASTGQVSEPTVEAAITITLGAPKIGLYCFPGRQYAGDIWVADIGIPPTSFAAVASRLTLLDRELVASLLPERSDDSHKGSFGHCLILGGSGRYPGAAVLTTYGALRAGAGLVTLGVPEPLLTRTLPGLLPETVLRGFPAEAESFALQAQDVQRLAGTATALVAGMGWGRGRQQSESLTHLLRHWAGRLLLDADALNAVDNVAQLADFAGPLVLTPHVAEFARLLGVTVAAVRANPVQLGRDFVQRVPCVLVLKSATTMVFNRDGHMLLCPQPNSGLARGGAGDLLAGLIGGFLAQGVNDIAAAVAGVMVHAEAAEITRAELGADAMTITEVAAAIPRALKRIRGQEQSSA